jgi:hypothetical protein
VSIGIDSDDVNKIYINIKHKYNIFGKQYLYNPQSYIETHKGGCKGCC